MSKQLTEEQRLLEAERRGLSEALAAFAAVCSESHPRLKSIDIWGIKLLEYGDGPAQNCGQMFEDGRELEERFAKVGVRLRVNPW